MTLIDDIIILIYVLQIWLIWLKSALSFCVQLLTSVFGSAEAVVHFYHVMTFGCYLWHPWPITWHYDTDWQHHNIDCCVTDLIEVRFGILCFVDINFQLYWSSVVPFYLEIGRIWMWPVTSMTLNMTSWHWLTTSLYWSMCYWFDWSQVCHSLLLWYPLLACRSNGI